MKRSYENRLAEKGRTVKTSELENTMYVSPKKGGAGPIDENEDFNYADF